MDQPIMGLNSRSFLSSALIAGVAIGLLSHIPVIECLNCLLLFWVWGGAIGAVYLYRRSERQPFLTMTQGIALGAAAGVVGAVVGGLAALLLSGLSTAFQAAIANMAENNGVSIPGFILGAGVSVMGIIANILIYGVVGAIGGLIATALIWKTPAAVPPPPPYTPPPSGPTL